MNVRDISYMGLADILRQKCAPVDPLDPTLKDLAFDMIHTMENKVGVGLAANQIGLDKAMFVAAMQADYRVFLNPTIVELSSTKQVSHEGCLSLPGFYEDLHRSEEVTIEYQEMGSTEVKRETFTGFYATVVQHEIDHLQGKLFVDHLNRQVRRAITSKWDKVLKRLTKRV